MVDFGFTRTPGHTSQEELHLIARNALGQGDPPRRARNPSQLLDVVKFNPLNPDNILPDRQKPKIQKSTK